MKNKLHNNKLKILVIMFVCFLFISVYIYTYKPIDTITYEYLKLHIDSLHENKKTLILYEKNSKNPVHEINLTLDFDSNKDSFYRAILLNNYEQVPFAIDNLSYNEIQKIKLSKTETITSTEVALKTENKYYDLNDYILLLLEEANEHMGKVKFFRFNVVNNTLNNISSFDSLYSKNFFNDGSPDHLKNSPNKYEYLTLLDESLEPIDSNISSLKKAEKVYLFVDLSRSLHGSPYYENFLDDIESQSNNFISLAVFLVDDQENSLFNNQVYYINTELKDKILIEVNHDFNVNDSFRIMCSFYPLEASDDKMNTYKMSIWDNVFFSSVFYN